MRFSKEVRPARLRVAPAVLVLGLAACGGGQDETLPDAFASEAAVDKDVESNIDATGVEAPLGDIFAPGLGKVPVKFTMDMDVPLESRAGFVDWAVKSRGETAEYAAKRWDRSVALLANKDFASDRERKAFLLTPREAFALPQNLGRAYDHAFLDIGYGVTISGPHAVGRMTSSLEIKPTDKVLEIGTGSGYQSALLSHLTDYVWSIEIIGPLAARTRAIYDALAKRGYDEFGRITSKHSDGYYGWEEAGPFDKIIVTCGVDHIPPPLLQQLKPGGIMVIPVGPPGAQHILKVEKKVDEDGKVTIARSDIYNGKIVPFVPFTKLEGDKIVGTHNK